MSKYSPKYGRVDKNQSKLVEYIRGLGASVAHTSNVHKGMVDIVVGHKGVNYLCEIKDGKGKLTPDQVIFFKNWEGQVQVIRTEEDVNDLLMKGL